LETQQLTFDFAQVQAEIVGNRDDDAIKLRLGEFDGPLDLLLHLIKQENVSIFDIPIARITDEYLRYLRFMKTLDIAVAGDFLVMAATLIEIKSKMLLPRLPEEIAEWTEEEIDPRQLLIERLLEHQKYKAAAGMLWTKVTVEQSVFTRGKVEQEAQTADVNVSMFDLLAVFQKILARQTEEIQLEIEREEISLAEMLDKLKQQISVAKELNLTEFFLQTRSKRELVTAFLAILELVRTARIRLVQSIVFGDIIAQNLLKQ